MYLTDVRVVGSGRWPMRSGTYSTDTGRRCQQFLRFPIVMSSALLSATAALTGLGPAWLANLDTLPARRFDASQDPIMARVMQSVRSGSS